MSHTSESAAHSHAHEHPHVNYLMVFVALCVCTLLSWIADEAGGLGYINSKRMIAVIVLAIAAAKALFVMMFFMHLKFEGNWKFVLLMPTFILACGLPLALAPDVGLHYYPQQVPQTEDASHAAPVGDAEGEAEESADEHAH